MTHILSFQYSHLLNPEGGSLLCETFMLIFFEITLSWFHYILLLHSISCRDSSNTRPPRISYFQLHIEKFLLPLTTKK